MSRFRPIHHTFGPHVTVGYALRSLLLLLQPWKYRSRRAVDLLKRELEATCSLRASAFANGREALLAYLRAIGLRAGEEVIVQGYTCVVLPNAIHAAGGVTVYADIREDTLNLDTEDVAKKITPRTRAVICQHTFGIPADTKELKRICRENDVLLIEDCAHVIPDMQTVGAEGDAVLLSFGRDKAVSGVAGGVMLVHDHAVAERLDAIAKDARPLGFFTILRLLLYPLFYLLLRPFYGLVVGKASLAMLAKLRLLVPILTREEKSGHMDMVPHAMPGSCALLALGEWRKRGRLSSHRRSLTAFYLQEAKKRKWKYPRAIAATMPLQKFPLFVIKAQEIRARLKTGNIHLDDGWTGCVICPAAADTLGAGYEEGCDPAAERAGESILSLPTHLLTSGEDAARLVECLDDAMRDVYRGR